MAVSKWSGASSIYATLARLTKLDPTGRLLVGADSSYTTPSVVTFSFSLSYTDPDDISELNGAGEACLALKAPSTLQNGEISDFSFCDPDPNVLQFLIGGEVIVTGTGDAAKSIGYKAPVVGTNPNPNGVSIELWSNAYIRDAPDPDYPYIWWVFPRCNIQPDGDWKFQNDESTKPNFKGTMTGNPNWGAGPDGAWNTATWGPADRVFQYVQIATRPNRTRGYVAVTAPTAQAAPAKS